MVLLLHICSGLAISNLLHQDDLFESLGGIFNDEKFSASRIPPWFFTDGLEWFVMVLNGFKWFGMV